jgi:glycyl-tRNA synthetase beta chain
VDEHEQVGGVMAELLLELLSEEIPARMQARACEDLKKLLTEAFAAQSLTFETIEAYATPRRLALHITGLPLAQPDVSEELKGPRTDAPEQALAGFLKKTGLTKEQLQPRDDGKKGQVYFAVIERTGRATSDVIADIIPTIIRTFPWPKSMRWGERSASTESLRWVRPLQSIICLFDGAMVPFEIEGVKSSNVTRGHRFMSMSHFTVDSFEDYRTKLRLSKVVLDPVERMKKIDDEAHALADKAGLVLVEDAGLLAENAGLTEWPVVLIGSFDEAYLDVPSECLTATMRANQKYFSLRDTDGKLANKFLCVANLEAKDKGKSIVAGNEKVLSARLSDAKFFWDQDRKIPLEAYLPKLEQIIFHEKLGTMAEKVARVEKLAEHIARVVYPQLSTLNKTVMPAKAGIHASASVDVESMDPSLRWGDEQQFIKTVKRAAALSKADLTTGMVGEFPELQGIMGRYYATAQGETADVAQAIEEHYKPQGPSDTVPNSPVSVCVALADKIDTLVGFFRVGLRPTGSSDPFALRRAALGVCSLVIDNVVSVNLSEVFGSAVAIQLEEVAHALSQRGQINQQIIGAVKTGAPYHDIQENIGAQFRDAQIAEFNRQGLEAHETAVSGLFDFIIDRLKITLRKSGIRPDIVEATVISKYADILKHFYRATYLQEFIKTVDGLNLLAGYKRAANILRIEEAKDGLSYSLDRTVMPSDAADVDQRLWQALRTAGPEVENELNNGNMEAAIKRLATLRAPVDAFFTDVMINDPDPAIRVRRLKLLAGVRDAMHKVADFSKIEG